jgi:hypothetical protein
MRTILCRSAPRHPTDTATPAAGPNQACAQLPTASSGLASANQGVAIFALARCTKQHATAPERYKKGGGGNSSAVVCSPWQSLPWAFGGGVACSADLAALQQRICSVVAVSGGVVQQKRAPGRAAAILTPESHKARARSCNVPCTSEDSELNCDLLMCFAGNGAAKKGPKSSSKDTCNHPWYGSDHLGVDDISNMLVQLPPAMPMSASLQTCKFA